MGLCGLFRYVKDADLERRAWKHRDVKGHLVIDGSQFCHWFYRSGKLDAINGGQYPEFYQNVTDFFMKLTLSGIVPHVVFEGIHKSQKLTDGYRLEKAEKRSRLNGLPQLAYATLRNVLTDMQIQSYRADGEGDEACVKIAKYLECPVLSNDSDFYIFNIPGGYIQLCDLKFSCENRVEADVYFRDVFAREVLGLHESDLLYMIPSILGNDLFPNILEGNIAEQLNTVPKKGWQEIDWIFSYLKNQTPPLDVRSCLDTFDDENLKKQFEAVASYYNPSAQNPEKPLASPIANAPEWFLKQHRKHAIPYMLVDALVNQKQHHNTSLVSLPIRQCCYCILELEDVREYHMNDHKAIISNVQCADLSLPSFRVIRVQDADGNKSRLFSLLGLTNDLPQDIEEKEKLFLSTIVFWKAKKAPYSYLVKALLACFVVCSSSLKTLQTVRNSDTCKYSEYKVLGTWLHDRRLFMDWQSIYNDAVALTTLLRCFSVVLCPSEIYDGKIVMSLASHLDGIDGVIERLQHFNLRKYHGLCRLIGEHSEPS